MYGAFGERHLHPHPDAAPVQLYYARPACRRPLLRLCALRGAWKNRKTAEQITACTKGVTVT
jgi:hypothetical protein